MAKRPTILATRKLPDAVEHRLERDYDARLNGDDRGLDRAALLARAEGADGLFICATDRVDRALIEALPDSLTMIGTLSAGLDHIDLEACRDRGLVVTATPDVLNEACAETTLLLMLAAARRGYEGDRMVRDGHWSGWAPTQLLGTGLTAKSLGIVGLGGIGQAVARRARAFGMTIHYHNRRPLPAAEEAGAAYHPTLESLLAASQFLSLHCPSTPATRGLLDGDRIALLPPGAIVINTARGDLVDDEALILALRSGRIAAAGLDVFNNEPALHPGYRRLANVFLFPHAGSATLETRNAMGFMVLDSFDAHFLGEPVPHRVL